MADIVAIKNLLLIIAPEFTTVDPVRNNIIDQNIIMYADDVDVEYFGTKTNRGVALLVAHNLTLSSSLNNIPISGGGGSSSNVTGTISKTKKKIGKLEFETTYSNSSNSGTSNNSSIGLNYTSTRYGQMYLDLLNQCKKNNMMVLGG
jgi:stress response protein SCP2